MYTLKRTHIKFLSSISLGILFFVCGFIINTGTLLAATSESSQSPLITVSYSISEVTALQTDGSYTTRVIIGCAPGSGDLYDMNTGKKCTYNTTTIIIGCSPTSGDKYDVNTGKLCKNDTSIAIYAPKIKAQVESMKATEPTITVSLVPGTIKLSTKSHTVAQATNKLQEIKPITQAPKETLTAANVVDTTMTSSDNSDNTLSGRQKLAKSLTASAQKASSIFHGPMSIWLILLIIIIVLGGGYGIYSLVFNSGEGLVESKPESAKSEVKQEEVKVTQTTPIPQNKPIQSEQPKVIEPVVAQVKPQSELPLNPQQVKPIQFPTGTPQQTINK